MKKIFVSVGLVAAGTIGVHAAYSPDSTDNSKIWAVSGTLRGFYDDNYTTTTKKQGSGGFEVSPSFSLNAPLAQTEIGMKYVYGLYYYQNRDRLGQNPIDQSHWFDLWLDHAFNPQWETRFEDTVTVSREPQLTVATAVPNRTEQNYIANNGKISLHTDWSSEFATQFSYQNSYYSYQQSGPQSLSALLDRDENYASLDLQWKVMPETTAFIGYQYGQTVYLGNEPIGLNYVSKDRDSRSEYGYVGATHRFLENLDGTVEAGVQYTTYYNDPSSKDAVGPYGNASMTYTYAPGSYAQIGVTETRNATETSYVVSNGQLVQDQESTVIYGSINHSLTAKLVASLVAHYQYSIYHGGGVNDQSAGFTTLGANLTYTINQHFSSEIGYNFDWYTSAKVLQQDYSRNRIYLGVTASY